LITTFCVCADGFQGLSKDFHYASLKLLTYFENAYCNPPQNSLLCDLFSLVISCDLLCDWLQGKCARINLSKAASCNHFQCQIVALGLLEAFSKLVSNLKEQARTLNFIFFINH
jgi:hypothetical protein